MMKTFYLICGRVMSSVFLLLLSLSVQAQTFYVNKNGGSDANTGASWGQAFQNLNKALAEAQLIAAGTTVEIRVAAGIYRPTEAHPSLPDDPRDAAFEFYRGDGVGKKLRVLGGYNAANGTRDIAANPTYLDGDIGTPGDDSDNSYHVVVISNLFGTSDDAIEMDGLTMRNARADASGSFTYNSGFGFIYRQRGGGLATTRNENGLKITNCTFSDNYSNEYSGGGSAFRFEESGRVEMEYCTITNNTGIHPGGGGWSSARGFIRNSTFTNNVAGALYVTSDDQLTVSNCTFEDNEGALSTQNSPIITGCTFSGNYGGGGAALQVGGSTQVSDCKFLNNEVTDRGGAVFAYGGSFSITHCEFLGNRAGNLGGAIYLSAVPFANIHDNVFFNNSTTAENGKGGAIYMDGIASTFNNNLFFNNQSAKGGAIYEIAPLSGYAEVTTLSNSTFTGNTANEGGAYYHENDPYYAEFVPDRYRRFKNCIFWNNSSEIFNTTPAIPASVTYSIVKGG